MRSCTRVVAALAALVTSTLGGCTPRDDAGPPAASSEESLSAASLAGTRWVAGPGASIEWLDIQRDPVRGLTYRAGRRQPFRSEAGTVLLEGEDLVLVRGHVKERFASATRGTKLSLRAGDVKLELVRAQPESPKVLPTTPPFPVATAVRAGDGKIYATGPARAAVTPFASFDPATRAWTELSPLPAYAERPPMVAGADGRVYLLGGSDSYILSNMLGAVPAVQAFDTEHGFWIEMPALPEARGGAGAARCPDGRLVVVGGSRGNGLGGPLTVYFRRPYLYDPRTGRTTLGKDSGVAVVGAAVASSASGIVYVVGGQDFTSWGVGSQGQVVSTRLAMAYDCRSDSWRTLPLMPSSRMDATAVTDEEGRLYVVGGRTGGGTIRDQAFASIEVFDPATQAWATLDEGVEINRPKVLPGPGHFWVLTEQGLRPLGPFGGGR